MSVFTTYKVQPGDTLYGISRKLGVGVDAQQIRRLRETPLQNARPAALLLAFDIFSFGHAVRARLAGTPDARADDRAGGGLRPDAAVALGRRAGQGSVASPA